MDRLGLTALPAKPLALAFVTVCKYDCTIVATSAMVIYRPRLRLDRYPEGCDLMCNDRQFLVHNFYRQYNSRRNGINYIYRFFI